MSNHYFKKGRRRGAIIKKTSKRSEDQEQQSLILRIKKEYQDLLILGDIAGAKLSKRAAQQAYDCRTGKGMPDIYIFKSFRAKGGITLAHLNFKNFSFLVIGIYLTFISTIMLTRT